jgi:hypothetical protein
MAALTGVPTDYNQGSQIRSLAEALGSVNERQGVSSQATAYQTQIYSALFLFGITPNLANAASGIGQFVTGTGISPPPASQSVPIPLGTIVQTNGGIQFATTAPVVLVSGTTSINAPVQAVLPGVAGNVTSGAISNIVTGLIYPLFVTNPAPMSGGANAETSSAALARFTASVAAIGLSSPVAIANAVIGVSVSGESVIYSTVYEPWVAAGSGAGSGIAGYNVFIDNGTGTASSGLINAATAKLLGGTTTSGASNAGGAIGYHDAGVPFNVFAVTPTIAVVSVSGVYAPNTNQAAVDAALQAAVSGYFTLSFGASAQQGFLSTAIANGVFGQLSSLDVALMASGSLSSLQALTTSPSGRVILGQLNLSLTS